MDSPRVYSGPVLLLTNPGCASACHIFATWAEQLGFAKLVGEPSDGSALAPNYRYLLYGYRLTGPAFDALGPDGKSAEGRILPVAYPVVPTAADWAAGRDPVLEKALEVLATEKK